MAQFNESLKTLEESILKALSTVQDPDLKKDLVSLGMIQNLQISSTGAVSFKVVLTTPACPMKEQMKQECLKALSSLPGVSNIQIEMTSKVRTKKSAQNRIEGVAQIIAVSSGKGGVGKSTVAVNLAMALAQEGAKVAILDADIYGPNIPSMMGVTGVPQLEEDPQRGELLIPPVAHGIKVMSMGFLIQPDQPVVWRGPMLHNVIQQFCHKVQWGDLDYLVIDMPPGTGDVQLSMAQIIPITGAVLVTTAQEVSFLDVSKAYAMFAQVRVPILGIVENMSYLECGTCTSKHFLFGQGGGERLANKFQTELLAQLPFFPEVRQAGDDGKPISTQKMEALSAQAFKTLAQSVAQQVSILSHEQQDPSQFIQIGKFH